uniref:Uncharacterized protein n=1 Tax=Oryza sativa subsp. japonica TaxID=39947 RepID=Q6EPX8_ORYSJ|nr:hypothetical protein [Oryza sativa Japonica Group]
MAAARRLHPKEGSGEPESGKRTRVRSHARSTWRSPAAQNRLLPRCRQRSQEDARVARDERRSTARSERPREVRVHDSAAKSRWVS